MTGLPADEAIAEPLTMGGPLIPGWLLCSLATVLFWGLWGLESKLMVERTSSTTNQFLFALGLPLPLLVMLGSSRRFSGVDHKRGLLHGVLSGLLTGFGNLAFFMALERGDASAVVPITSLAPLATVLTAAVALHERLNRLQWIGLSLALVSIFLLTV